MFSLIGIKVSRLLKSICTIKNYSCDLGAVIGFISKQECQRQLLASPPGTFMLRFSDSKLGAISTAYCVMENGKKEVCHLEPDTVKLLQVRSLADMIKDFANLTYLYPNKPKHEVFSKYYT